MIEPCYMCETSQGNYSKPTDSFMVKNYRNFLRMKVRWVMTLGQPHL